MGGQAEAVEGACMHMANCIIHEREGGRRESGSDRPPFFVGGSGTPILLPPNPNEVFTSKAKKGLFLPRVGLGIRLHCWCSALQGLSKYFCDWHTYVVTWID